MIMTIPILFLIQFVLDNYACKKPRMAIADVSESKKIDANEETQAQAQEQAHVREAAYNSEVASEIEQCQSDFARIIRRSSGSDTATGVATAIEIAHFAYAGNLVIMIFSQIFYYKSFCHVH
jgi:hypothetical protein